jgi:hypothetical protein
MAVFKIAAAPASPMILTERMQPPINRCRHCRLQYNRAMCRPAFSGTEGTSRSDVPRATIVTIAAERQP